MVDIATMDSCFIPFYVDSCTHVPKDLERCTNEGSY
jgi:hypothetical protein